MIDSGNTAMQLCGMAGNKRMPYGQHYSLVILKNVATLLLKITFYSIELLLNTDTDHRYNGAGVGYYT